MSKPAPTSHARDESWIHRETSYHPNDEALAATRFFLGNGLIGLRGSLDELGTRGVQGLYLAGVFRQQFVRQFETADTYTRKRLIFDEEIMPHGAPVQQIQGLPDILFCRLLIGGHPFRLWEGHLHDYEGLLDLRRGLFTRRLRWTAPGGATCHLEFQRFCSWSDPRLVWQRIVVTAESACPIVIAPGVDPLLEPDLESLEVETGSDGWRATAVCAGTDIRVPMVHHWRWEGPAPVPPGEWGAVAGRPACFHNFELPAGESIVLERVTGLAPDNHPRHATGIDALDEVVVAALATGFASSLQQSTECLAAKWAQADVELDGPVADQFGLRFALYQLLAAAPWEHDHISLGAKCLSGPGYNGHVFWDNDINILPFYQWVFPGVAANHCRYRHRMLDDARKIAASENRPGARYPWQSALEGWEQAPEFIRCSRTQIHVVADVAHAANRLLDIAGEQAMPPLAVAEISLECARYLASRLTLCHDRYECHGIGGPDEYHPLTDNNAYTLYLIDEVLARAIAWAEKFPATTTRDEIAAWKERREKLYRPFDPETGLIPQCDGFFELEEVWEEVGGNWGGIGAEFERCKALKQPDVLLLLPLLAYRRAFPEPVWRRNWDYYERFILHGSSLSPSIHALVAARVGLPQRARHYFDLAARFEFRNQNNDTQHGIHIGNCGGLWQAVIPGFAGLHEGGEAELGLDPCFPQEWRRLTFRLTWQGQGFRVELTPRRALITADAANQRPVRWSVFGICHAVAPSQSLSIDKPMTSPGPAITPAHQKAT